MLFTGWPWTTGKNIELDGLIKKVTDVAIPQLSERKATSTQVLGTAFGQKRWMAKEVWRMR